MAIIIRADATLTAVPAGTPRLPNAQDNLLSRYSALDLSLGAGQDITAWGTSPVLNTKMGTQTWPKFNTESSKAVARFTRTTFTHIHSDILPTALSSPFTVVALVKSTAGGIVIGGTTNAFRLVGSAGKWRIVRWGSAVTDQIVHTAGPDGTWQVLTAVINGSASSLAVNGVAVAGSVAGVSQASRLCVGAHTFGTTGYETDYYDGDMAEVSVYGAALDADTAAFIAADMRNRHGR